MDPYVGTVRATDAREFGDTWGLSPACPDPCFEHRTIGFLSPTLNGYYFGDLLIGITDAARAGGSRVVAIQTCDAGLKHISATEDPFWLPLAWQHIDTFIVVLDAVPDSYVHALARAGKDIVLISREVPGVDCPIVVPDNDAGIAATIAHLVQHGHRQIAFADRLPTHVDDAVRFNAYQDEMRARGLEPCDSVTILWEGEEISAEHAASQLLGMQPRPTAVVVSTDVTAIMLIQALAEVGIEVPRDMAVVGFDNIDDAATHQPSLTTVAQTFTLVGRFAGQLAVSALDGSPGRSGQHLVPVELVERESCGCPAPAAGTPAAAATSTDRFAADLIAALQASGQPAEEPRSIPDLILALMSRAGTAQIGTPQSAVLADQIVALYQTVASNPGLEVGQRITTIATEIHEALRGRSATPVATLLRCLARSLATELGIQDAATMLRLDDLAYDLSTAIFEQHVRSRSAEQLYFQKQFQHYEISTDLLRRCNRASRSLGWLGQTEVRAGCLALWQGRAGDPGSGVLAVVANYDEAAGDLDGGEQPGSGERQGVGEQYVPPSFPPRAMFDLLDGRIDDLMYLLPVRFDGSDWGVLALIGPLEMQAQITLEMINHWSVLLTVALDQEEAVRSLLSQREDLLAGYERERTLLNEIRVSEERYALAADAANDGLWDWDLTRDTAYYSTRWTSLLGYRHAEVGSTPQEWLDRVHPEDRPELDRVLATQFDGSSSTMELELRILASDQTYRWMLTRGRCVRDERGDATRLVGSMTDITDRKRLEDQFRHDALYDMLTGLPNRTLYLERLNQAIEVATGRPEHRFAVVFLDLDGFKIVNDSLGHHAGDEVLTQVAERLSKQIRPSDTVARFGGDEFAVLIEGVQQVSDIVSMVDRIIANLEAPLTLGTNTVGVSAAAGIAVGPAGSHTASEYIRDADTAMYRAKAMGRGSSVLFDESMHTGAVARLQIESDLRDAIAGDQFVLYYQPIVDLATGRTVGLEALLRWHHPVRGFVSPAEFLPVAETTGAILPIGRWTVDEVCRRLRDWRASGAVGADLAVSVNLSNRQFWDPDLRSYVQQALREHEVPASALVFEVTEGVIMHNPETAGNLMRQLRNDRIRLHIDDFGTGYSSLEALHTFPIDALKIDRSFVARINTNARSIELVRIMIAMGHNLGVDVIAEGIEDQAQAATLAGLGHLLVQGYHYSRPVPAAEVPGLLENNRSRSRVVVR